MSNSVFGSMWTNLWVFKNVLAELDLGVENGKKVIFFVVVLMSKECQIAFLVV